jgi:hypothetical protein
VRSGRLDGSVEQPVVWRLVVRKRVAALPDLVEVLAKLQAAGTPGTALDRR